MMSMRHVDRVCMPTVLTDFAADQQRRFDALISPDVRKEQGHFGTPPVIAEFMAGLFSLREGAVRVLDPGAGVGTLSAAICQRVLRNREECRLHFELWENDPKLISLIQRTMSNCQKTLLEAGHTMDFVVRVDDFILANTQKSLFSDGRSASFDIAILNPPYFKLRKDSPHARAMRHVVHGQPNIYALFMALAADLLVPHGELVAITPRSYFSGAYFQRFRKWFFDRMTARQIHLFESRTDAFREDTVLQENVILKAEKQGHPRDIRLTSSTGRDLVDIRQSSASYDSVIDNRDGDHVIRFATNAIETEIVSAMDDMPGRFRDLGVEISTGPVVSFRSTEHLRKERGPQTAPLLWPNHVRPFVTRSSHRNGKPGHIEIRESSLRLLLPAKTYVLLKRFTAKEEKRRLVAGIMTREDSYSDWIGLENHLNYVYRPRGELALAEAFGLAAYFNSAFVDRYFRAISGNTQVNATDIRSMPVPSMDVLIEIGEEVLRSETTELRRVEKIVGKALRLDDGFVHSLNGRDQ